MFQRPVCSSCCALIAGVACVLGAAATASGQLTTGWTYQGELKDADAPANGDYDFQFRLFDAASGNVQIGPMLCRDNIAVQDGRFVTQLDFGSVYVGGRLFLEVAVRSDSGQNCGNPAGFLTLGPRQELTVAPNAAYSLAAASAGTANTAANAVSLGGQAAAFYLQRSNHTGSLPTNALSGSYTSAVSMNNAANSFTGIFTGSGANVTGLNAGNIASGILGLARGGTGADTSGATSGQVLKFNGSTWAPGTDIDTNTTYTAGSGLALAGTVFSVPVGGITSTMILDGAVVGGDLAPSTVGSGQLASDAISLSKVTGGAASIIATNMGIGATPSASAKLNVGGALITTGNATIGGTVTTDAVVLPATARMYSVPMIAFLPWDGSTGTGLITVDDVHIEYSSTTGADKTLYAGVNLPNGATVTGLYMHVEDASNTDLTLALVRRGLDGSAGSTLASVVSSGNVAGTRLFSDTVISSATIDNSTYAYMVKVVFAPTITNPNPPILHGIRIGYTVTAPLP